MSIATAAPPSLGCAAESPAACYARLLASLAVQQLPRPAVAYVRSRGGAFLRDHSFPCAPSWPAQLDEDALGAEDSTLLYAKLGEECLVGFVFAPLDASTREHLQTQLDQEFAPAFYVASRLVQTERALERANEQIYYLREMSRLLGVLDAQALLVNILELTTSLLRVDVGSIVLLDDQGAPRTEIDWGLPHAAISALQLRDGRCAVEMALASKRAHFLTGDDLTGEMSERIEKLALLPLESHQQFLGLLILVGAADQAEFTEERLEVVRPGLGLAAMALENALLVRIKLDAQREHEQIALGQNIQQGLLPQDAPQLPGVSLAGHSVAAKMIGGDYYDYLMLPDGQLGLVVADVAGKGVPAGLIMTATRAMFRAAALELRRPAEILEQVNRLLCAENFGGRFVTAIFAKLDLAAGRILIAAAGHEPALRIRAGAASSEPVPALPLGLRADARYQEREMPVEPGDIVVFFTDGVTEAMDEGRRQFGQARLIEALRACDAEQAPALLQRILEAVDMHIGKAPRHDDTTLIVARVGAGTGPDTAHPEERR